MTDSDATGSGSRGARLFPCALLIGVSVLAFAPFLLKGIGFLYGDVLRGYRPIHMFAMDRLWDGGAFWCPLAGYGHPVLAGGEMPLFYPPAFLAYTLLGVDLGMSVLLPFHAAVAAVLTFLLARRLRISSAAAVCAGLAFALSGWVFGHLVHMMFLWSAAWLPGVFLGLHGLFHDDRGRGRVLLPLSVAAMLLACSWPVAFVAAVTCGGWLVVMLVRGARGGRGAGIGRVAPQALIGVGIAAAAVLPIVHHLGESGRAAPMGSEELLELSWHPLQAATMVSPFALGASVPGDAADPLRYFGRPNFQELSAYVGGLTLLLAVFALWRARRRRLAVLLWAGVGVLFLVALGAHTPVGRALAGIPGFTHFRVLPRFLLPATLCLSLLGALGLDGLLSAKRRTRRRFSTVLLGLGALAGIIALLLLALEGTVVSAARDWMRENVIGRPGRDAPAEHYLALPEALLRTVRDSLWRPAALALLLGFAVRFVSVGRLGWAVAVLLALDLVSMHWMGSRPRKAPPPPEIGVALRQAGVRTVCRLRGGAVSNRDAWRQLQPNVNVQAGLASPGVDSQLGLVGRDLVWNAMNIEPREDGTRVVEEHTVDLLRGLGVEAVVFDRANGPVEMEGGRVIAQLDGVVALAVPDARPAAWCEYHITGHGEPAPRVRIEEEGPARLVLSAESAYACLIVVRGAHAPGWTARVNGEEAPILVRQGLFRAVEVAAGANTVEMTYRPPGLLEGAATSALSLLVLGLLGFARRRRAQ